jgi:adenine-specific DNA-methyltransferase
MKELGQYFTSCDVLQHKVIDFIRDKTIEETNQINILEPSFGIGHLIKTIIDSSIFNNYTIDGYEIDKTLERKLIIDNSSKCNLIYSDFIDSVILKKYDYIIGNPPYVKVKYKKNLYIQFIEKCFDLLKDSGIMIMIVPSDFIKLSSCSFIINRMLLYGYFSDFYFPNNEQLFTDASIDIVVFKYIKTVKIDNIVVVNGINKCLRNNDGIITFIDTTNVEHCLLKDIFDIYVGMVSGKDTVFKHPEFGNINVLTGMNKIERFIQITSYPTTNHQLNDYLLKFKHDLINRRIRKFTERDWFTWGALRNKKTIEDYLDKDLKCIYIQTMTRNEQVCFIDNIQYFGGSLICLIPKNPKLCLVKVVDYLNSDTFKENYIYSKRFKIGHKQLSNANIPLHMCM